MWLISDTHWNHANILKFTSSWKEGRIRPEFGEDAIEEMNQAIVDRWNAKVRPGEKIYHMGDIGSNMEWLSKTLPMLNGKKRLILGNHDNYKMSFYEKFFEKIMVSRRIDSILITHYPTFLGSHEMNIRANIHGHIHENNLEDLRYVNVSVEQTGYAPIHIEDVKKLLRARGIVL